LQLRAVSGRAPRKPSIPSQAPARMAPRPAGAQSWLPACGRLAGLPLPGVARTLLSSRTPTGLFSAALTARESCAVSPQQCTLYVRGTTQPSDQTQARVVVSKLSDGQDAIFTVPFPSQNLWKIVRNHEKASRAIFQKCTNDVPVVVCACEHSIQLGQVHL